MSEGTLFPRRFACCRTWFYRIVPRKVYKPFGIHRHKLHAKNKKKKKKQANKKEILLFYSVVVKDYVNEYMKDHIFDKGYLVKDYVRKH